MALNGVIFDFHQTLATAGSLETWVRDAVAVSGDGDDQHSEILPVLRTVWERAGQRYPNSEWDLDPDLHRKAFTDVLTSQAACSPRLAAALYDMMPGQWVPVPGAIDLLQALQAGGRRVGLVSNIGLDIRPRLAQMGLLTYLDTVVLSYQEGLVKPDPRIFTLAADRLGLPAEECVFVGDHPHADGGAVHAGMTSILVPARDHVPQLHLATALLTQSAR